MNSATKRRIWTASFTDSSGGITPLVRVRLMSYPNPPNSGLQFVLDFLLEHGIAYGKALLNRDPNRG